MLNDQNIPHSCAGKSKNMAVKGWTTNNFQMQTKIKQKMSGVSIRNYVNSAALLYFCHDTVNIMNTIDLFAYRSLF